jgi:ethanolamine utilization cobalamin adenosyltransferase
MQHHPVRQTARAESQEQPVTNPLIYMGSTLVLVNAAHGQDFQLLNIVTYGVRSTYTVI